MELSSQTKMSFLSLLLLFMSGIYSHNCIAEQWQLEYGVAQGLFKMPYKGMKNQTTPLPIINAQYENWRFGVHHGLIQYVVNKETVETAFGLNYRDETYDSATLFDSELSDDPVFNGYKAPDGDFTLDFQTQYKNLEVNISQDISDNSGGLVASAMLNIPLYRFDFGLMLAADIGVNWQDEEYVNHVYGISEENSDLSVGRTVYQGTSATNIITSLKVIYPLTNQLSLSLIATNKHLDKSITQSPIITNDNSQLAIFSIIYKM